MASKDPDTKNKGQWEPVMTTSGDEEPEASYSIGRSTQRNVLSCCSNASDAEAGEEGKMERATWGNRIEFILSCCSYAVGLGAIWRFPYLVYRNGGGAFLVAYLVMYVLAGLPLFFFELAFGQYASEGPISIWKVCPMFQGIGYAMFLMSFFIGIYYNVVVAWSFHYLFASMQSTLPWISCFNSWNTLSCRDMNCTLQGGLLGANGECIYRTDVDEAAWEKLQAAINVTSPAEEYFHNEVLKLTDGIDNLGTVQWEVALCLLLAWVCVFLALLRGIKSFGKAVYFTALFPYLILTILLVRAATLPGYSDGIYFYLMPDWDSLANAKVWGDAAMQIFFSLSPCWGGLITLASYNKFHNNCFRDALIVATGNVLTAFFAGFVIFGVIGYMAHEMNVPIKEVAAQGAGLAFIVYPEAVSQLPVAPLWSFLFFFMLLTLGLGTQFTVVETVVTTIVDLWPDQLRGRNHKWVLLAACTLMYLLGLFMCTGAGMYILQLIDSYAATFSALIIGLVELLVISWHYGVDRFLDDIKLMLGHYPTTHTFWKIMWKFVTPIAVVAILFFSIADYRPLEYGEYVFPVWANVVGLFISLASVSMIPCVAIWKLESGTLLERARPLMKPTSEWGPALAVNRREAGIPLHQDSQIPLTHQDSCPPYEYDPKLDAVVETNDSGLHM